MWIKKNTELINTSKIKEIWFNGTKLYFNPPGDDPLIEIDCSTEELTLKCFKYIYFHLKVKEDFLDLDAVIEGKYNE